MDLQEASIEVKVQLLEWQMMQYISEEIWCKECG